MNHYNNRERIKIVAMALGSLKEKVVFVGGATISLYASWTGTDPRHTDDIDIIVEIFNYSQRAELEENLRTIHFEHDRSVICRWHINGIIVDIMPTNDDSIGFKNIWYPEAYKNAINYSIDEECTVKVLSSPYFIATKLEAFKGRGKGDGRTSQDFEDIIYIFENR